MVAWFGACELFQSGVRLVLSSVFGAYADQREMQAALSEPGVYEEHTDAGEEGIWIDFIADSGDGFDSTYTIAWLAAQEKLLLKHGDQTYDTWRGQVLVLGGDQVYPTPSREAYRDRFHGPFRTALPFVEPDHKAPSMFAIPGNHDWYDGLRSFGRLFCQKRWIGGWRTKQTRSYFAIQLPFKWWIWGIDIQLHADVDEPQKQYFRGVVKTAWKLNPYSPQPLAGHSIILCTAEPSWLKKEGGYDTLQYFEDVIIGQNGGRVALTLTGDLHHYARYSKPEDASTDHNKITVGGGGAYLLGTHDLPPKISPAKIDASLAYERKTIYPDEGQSKKLARGVLRFPLLRRNWTFCFALGILYLLYAWTLGSATLLLVKTPFPPIAKDEPPTAGDSSHANVGDSTAQECQQNSVKPPDRDPFPYRDFFKDITVRNHQGVRGVLVAWFTSMGYSPGLVVFTAAILLAFVAFCGAGNCLRKWVIGLVHGISHLALCVAIIWVVNTLINIVYTLEEVHVENSLASFLIAVPLFSGAMLGLGFFGGGFIFGAYLFVTNRLFGLHTNEVFVAQAIETHKNFLRMHLRPDGLVLYPIKVEEICKDWEPRKVYNKGESPLLPRKMPNAELIEEVPGFSLPAEARAPRNAPSPPSLP